MKTGAELIAKERARQMAQEGWTPEHDDQHDERELARAAQCYLDHYVARQWVIENDLGLNVKPGAYQKQKAPDEWPWAKKWWKPKGKIEDLVRVGALIAAEIDRLQRASDKSNDQRQAPASK